MTLTLLTSLEQRELDTHEAVIERGLRTFTDVVNALLAIRDKRLYRVRYGTFEDYCRKRWGMVRRQANRLIAAAETVNILGPMGPKIPGNERQVRPLTCLEPDQQREAWQRAVETAPDGRVTGAHVQRVVDETFFERWASDNRSLGLDPFGDPLPPEETTPDKMAVHYSSETPEWYTPPEIITRTLQVLEQIDLDPCSNDHDAPNVPAVEHYTQEDDGLSHDWHGRVYMNPPYGRGIADWVEYLCQQYEAGNVTEAIALVPSRTDTQWFRRLREYPRCFVWGRLHFSNNDVGAPFPSMVIYFGYRIEEFVNAFSTIGDIYVRLKQNEKTD